MVLGVGRTGGVGIAEVAVDAESVGDEEVMEVVKG